jgi:hypothetical protein
MPSIGPPDLSVSFEDDAPAAEERVSAADLDANFLVIEEWCLELLTKLALLIRDDDTLADYVVRYRNLHPEIFAELTAGLGSVELAIPSDGSVTTSKVALLAITTALLADLAVTTGKIADDAVTAAKMADLAVETAALANLAVTTAKMADGAVTTAKLGDLAVTAAKLAADAVTTAKIADAQVTAAKLAADAVTTTKIADGAVTAAKLAAGAVSEASLNLVSQLGLRNRIINGCFRIDQRGSNVSSVANDAYGRWDRWYALNQSGNQSLSQLTDPEAGSPYAMRMTQPDASPKRIGTAQIIENINVRDLRGKQVTLSARIRCSSSQAIRYAIIEYNDDGVPVSDVVNDWTSASFTAGGFFKNTLSRYVVAGTGSVTPAANTWANIGGAVTLSAACEYVTIIIWSEATLAQNATLDLARVQLEPGPSATPFEMRPAGLEMNLCRRYGFLLSGNLGVWVSATECNLVQEHTSGMALSASATVSKTGTGNVSVGNGGTGLISAASPTLAVTANERHSLINISGLSGATAERVARLASINCFLSLEL